MPGALAASRKPQRSAALKVIELTKCDADTGSHDGTNHFSGIVNATEGTASPSSVRKTFGQCPVSAGGLHLGSSWLMDDVPRHQ